MQRVIAKNPNIKISTFIIGYDVDRGTEKLLRYLVLGEGRYFDAKNSKEMTTTLNTITSGLYIS
ncbi:MAG: hypothetical protein GXZ15_05865 [Campylobacter sp.]|nr:hypothetical protein [Campylobacter sp.]